MKKRAAKTSSSIETTKDTREPCCVFCGSKTDPERHHVGGRNHEPGFTLVLCRAHHVQLTRELFAAGVDMTYTDDKRERIARALQATTLFQWKLAEELRTCR
jgi:hypothetical protein